jgi:23S rRNA (cytidine1920-2'-O)/16S rRNA (cytidine1409-2'-O)-methyltransferase
MEQSSYVSRGGIKLEKALEAFKLDVSGRICLDIGASTGGFTDCLLQHGAARVYAVDVGYGILAWELRKDKRVKVLERTNARYLTADKLYEEADPLAALAVIDVSFISLAKIFPTLYTLLANPAEVVALVKPQFEARREQVSRGGIIRDEKVHQEVLEKVKAAAQACGFHSQGTIPSPITGAEGNVEFLLYLTKE